MSHEKLETIHVEEFSDTVREIIEKSKKVQIKREDSSTSTKYIEYDKVT
jgi:hypothetical protein